MATATPQAKSSMEPGILERIGDKFILYNGWITNCKLPNPWWLLRGPKFDIIPKDRAIAYRSTFVLRIPVFAKGHGEALLRPLTARRAHAPLTRGGTGG